MLKVTPLRGGTRFGKHTKIIPRYIGPFPVNKKINPVAFQLTLPPELSRIHDVFHVSQLKPFYGKIEEHQRISTPI